MYLLGYSLDNLSLMALTISTGFVVDDAIVVMENITRHIEDGMAPFAATLRGRKGDWLYRADHQHLPDRGLYPSDRDGRNRRTALPRIRHHALDRDSGVDGHLADHDPNDVRPPAEEPA